MTNLSAPAPTADKAGVILQVFQSAAHPLTLSQAQKLYNGPKLKKNELAQIVEGELLMKGQVFRCSPARKQSRYWDHDEEQRVRETIEVLLGRGPLPQSKLATAVNKALPRISSSAAIRNHIQALRREGRLHERPGKGKTKLLSLQRYDPLADISFKAATLKDLSNMLAKVESLGRSMEQFLQVLRERLRPSTPATPTQPEEQGNAEEQKGEHEDQGRTAFPLGGALEPPHSEIDDLLLKGMHDLNSAVEQGASVLLRDLRRHMPEEYRRHETFDAAVLRLAEEGRIVLHRHDQPSTLTDAERNELVRDEAGTYYTSIAQRV
jgi:hypothetical protein